MLTTFGNNKKSLTFYQAPPVLVQQKVSTVNSGSISAAPIAHMAYSTGFVTNGFNNQLSSYLTYNHQTQQALFAQTAAHMNKVYQTNPSPKATTLRDHTTWAKVKRFVTREELMKLQIGGKADLPLSEEQLTELRNQIDNKNLALDDPEVQKIIDSIVRPDDSKYLEAIREFQRTGKHSSLLQSSKLDALKKELDMLEPDKPFTNEQFKYFKDNYCERPEYHHRESISSDPTQQSNADNIDILDTTKHDLKHTHINEHGEETIDYRKPVKEAPHNRNQELKEANAKRVFRNELRGLGLAAAIGAGIGFTIGFITTLAQSGISPDSLKTAATAGFKGGLESGALSAVGFGIGRTIGEIATQAITRVIQNVGITITSNLAQMISMGTVGMLSITLFSAYQFIKAKAHGVSTRESLIQTGKQALFSLSILAVSIAAQGIWGGSAGIIVSISAGIVMITYSVVDSLHQRKFADYIRVYIINKCFPSYT